MKIQLEQKNIGAAVMQIAEHEKFTAINALKINSKTIPNAFIVNHNTAVLCKYATDKNSMNEYVFTFTKEHLENIKSAGEHYENVFFGLVCVKDSEICCLSLNQLNQLIDYRMTSAGGPESQYGILVTLKKGESFRAFVNACNKKNRYTGKRITVARKEFPEGIFK